MWNDHWSIMKPAYFIIWVSFNINLRFSKYDVPGPQRLYSINMWSTPAVWKQYNKLAVLHFFLVNPTLIYILFSLVKCQTQQLLKQKKIRQKKGKPSSLLSDKDLKGTFVNRVCSPFFWNGGSQTITIQSF